MRQMRHYSLVFSHVSFTAKSYKSDRGIGYEMPIFWHSKSDKVDTKTIYHKVLADIEKLSEEMRTFNPFEGLLKIFSMFGF